MAVPLGGAERGRGWAAKTHVGALCAEELNHEWTRMNTNKEGAGEPAVH